MASFQPNIDTLKQIVDYLKETQIPDNNKQQEVYQKTETMVQNPEFFMYLATIMSHNNDFELQVRLLAAVTLQALSNRYYDKISQNQQTMDYIKQQIYKTFNDSHNSLCSKVGNIVTVLIQHGSFASWPEILDFLHQNLQSNNQHLIEVTISCITKIVEDLRLNYENYSHIDDNKNGSSLNQIIPKLLEFCNPQANKCIRGKSLYCLNMCVYVMPEKFEEQLPLYCEILLQALYDQEASVRLRAVQGIQSVMETTYQCYFDKKEEDVVKGIVKLSGDENYEVAKNACNFWMEYIQEFDEEDDLKKKLSIVQNHLQSLVVSIIKGMRFTDEDLMNQLPSGKNVIQSKPNVIEGDNQTYYVDQHEDQQNKDFFDHGEDTLRRVCGILIQKFSKLYRDQIFTIAQPIIAQLFQSNTWQDQEMGILTLGGIAEGSIEVITEHLPVIFPQLMQKMAQTSEAQFLSTTLWTLSKFTSYIVQVAPQQENLVKEYLQSIVLGIQHQDSKVQESSCYALSILIDQGSFILRPFVVDILQVFISAITKYNGQSLELLYEAVQNFVREMETEFQSQEQAKIILDPLVQKFTSMNVEDPALCSVSECLACISDILDKFFGAYCQPVFQKCYQMMDNFIGPQSKDKHNEYNRKEIFLRAIDIMSSLVLVTKQEFAILIQNSQFLQFINLALDNQYIEVKQFTVSLIAEIGKHCPQLLDGQLEGLIQKIATFIEFHPRDLDPEGQSGALCNNAVWCLSEFIFSYRQQLQPFAFQIAQKLVEFLNSSEQIDKTVARSFSKALGQLGIIDPQQIGQMLSKFIKPFCITLRGQREDQSYAKGKAFHGLFQMIKANPQGVMQDFQYLIECFVNYKQAKPELKQEFMEILIQFKNTMDDQQWDNYLRDPQYFTPGFRNKVQQDYNV